MTPRTRISIASAAAIPLALGSGLAFAADTTLGDSSTTPTQGCGSLAYTELQVATGGGKSYAAPADGVITSYSVAGPAGEVRALKTGRLANGVWTVAGESAKSTIPAGGLLTAKVRVPMRAGDVLGQYIGAGGTCEVPGVDGDMIYYEQADVTPGGQVNTGALNSGQNTTYRDPVSGVLEPDADHDGYGDTTQDKCPSQANTQGLCATGLGAIGAPSGKAKVGKTLTAPAVIVPSGATESFQWFRVSKKHKHHRTVVKPIGGATGPTYKAKKKDKGKKVFVRITLSGPNFIPATADSPARKVK